MKHFTMISTFTLLLGSSAAYANPFCVFWYCGPSDPPKDYRERLTKEEIKELNEAKLELVSAYNDLADYTPTSLKEEIDRFCGAAKKCSTFDECEKPKLQGFISSAANILVSHNIQLENIKREWSRKFGYPPEKMEAARVTNDQIKRYTTPQTVFRLCKKTPSAPRLRGTFEPRSQAVGIK
jgi:hypothetical protein